MLRSVCVFWFVLTCHDIWWRRVLFCGATLTRLDIIGVDWLLQFGAISNLYHDCHRGAANAINIIDGYNGLAAVISAMIFAGFSYVSYYLGDRLLLITSVGMIGAIVGFLVWNYPRGLIFLGDGGAYFIGFMIGAVSVLMLARHPEVSAWFPLLLCIYPVLRHCSPSIGRDFSEDSRRACLMACTCICLFTNAWYAGRLVPAMRATRFSEMR